MSQHSGSTSEVTWSPLRRATCKAREVERERPTTRDWSEVGRDMRTEKSEPPLVPSVEQKIGHP
jgi:hypothetical protein